jgi:hypothetical protein
MSRMQRDKGARFEREIVNWHRARGVESERIPLSGACKGNFGGDLRIAGYLVEAKIRANGFRDIYKWLAQDNADMLVLRADHRDPVYVLTQETWDAILGQLGLKKDILS